MLAILGVAFNAIADALSKNDFGRAQAVALKEFQRPILLVQ